VVKTENCNSLVTKSKQKGEKWSVLAERQNKQVSKTGKPEKCIDQKFCVRNKLLT